MKREESREKRAERSEKYSWARTIKIDLRY
jgi:hypothetical protein